jgi:hypothetical protein
MSQQLQSLIANLGKPQNWPIWIWVVMTVLAWLISLVVPNDLKIYLWMFSGVLVVVGIATAFTGSSIAQQYPNDVVPVAVIIFGSLTGGLILISGAAGFAAETGRDSALRAAIGWALAYFFGGFLIGFLFGIPRVVQEAGVTPSEPRGDSGSQTGQRYQQRVNTNLEQISDWLTKIIVGLGLVELHGVPGQLYQASSWMAQSFCGTDSTPAVRISSFACAFIIFFVIDGFIGGYLLTRLFLAGAFWRAEERPAVSTVRAAAPVADPTIDRIRNWWRPGGQIDPSNENKLQTWLKTQAIDVTIPVFLFAEGFAAKRAEAIQALNIP